jgi:DNA-binding response OmpR family regulator
MPINTARLLLVAKDPVVLVRLRGQLRGEGREVYLAPDDAASLTSARELQPDLLLLALPRLDAVGLERCRGLRALSAVPIILMTETGVPGAVEAALEAGADDCVDGAVSTRELVARVKAKLRYSPRWPAAERPGAIVLDTMRIDLGRHSVFVGGREVPLRAKEFDLLAFLARHAGQAVAHDEILRHVWGIATPKPAVDRKTVAVHVRWLREKIEEAPAHPRFLRTVRNVGYLLAG